MKLDLKKVAAIHDISGYGRASLTTVIPIISSMGSQVCPIPTAVLSTHTGGFGNPKIIDLTLSMEEYISHWKSLNLNFDCIYSGYLGSVHQINIISKFIKEFKTLDTLVAIDPVMGDDYALYKGIDFQMVNEMRKFIKLADLITPNYTEACYILNKRFDEKLNENELIDMLKSLAKIGPKVVIITSVPLDANVITTACYDKEKDYVYLAQNPKLDAEFQGTGDAFTSVIVGSMLKEYNIKKAVDKAIDFVDSGIKISLQYDFPHRDGMILEKVLYKIVE